MDDGEIGNYVENSVWKLIEMRQKMQNKKCRNVTVAVHWRIVVICCELAKGKRINFVVKFN